MTYTLNSPDADVILRARPQDAPGTGSRSKDFHVHKLILSIASTVFRDIFSHPERPQPAKGQADLPIVEIQESPVIVEIFLLLIYPIEPLTIQRLDLVKPVFQLASVYAVSIVHTKLRQILVSPSFLKDDPVKVYAIACHMNFRKEMELAITHTYKTDLVQIPASILGEMTSERYNDLLKSHATRRENLLRIIVQELPSTEACSCGSEFYTALLMVAANVLWNQPVIDGEKLKSCLWDRLKSLPPTCQHGVRCRASPREFVLFIIGVLTTTEKLYGV